MAGTDKSPFRDREPIENQVAEQLLSAGDIEVLGHMPWSSNTTLLCDVTDGDTVVQAIYKPARGERPLWDFPSGLFRREVACYRLAKAIGWDLVPPTVEVDGPAGPGSLQLFVPARFEEHYLTINEQPEHQAALRQLTAFDVIANSTDRKSGHVLVDKHGHIWAIDNGLSFHVEFKLRTVLWDYAGEPIDDELRSDLNAMLESSALGEALVDLLDADEIDAAEQRCRRLLLNGRFPVDTTGRRWPWPLV